MRGWGAGSRGLAGALPLGVRPENSSSRAFQAEAAGSEGGRGAGGKAEPGGAGERWGFQSLQSHFAQLRGAGEFLGSSASLLLSRAYRGVNQASSRPTSNRCSQARGREGLLGVDEGTMGHSSFLSRGKRCCV